MTQLASLNPNRVIVVTLFQQLNWSRFFALLPLKDNNAGTYYARVAREERWSVSHLRQRNEAVSLKPINHPNFKPIECDGFSRPRSFNYGEFATIRTLNEMEMAA